MTKASESAEFLTKSPTPYHFCEYSRSLLVPAGYVEVSEHHLPSTLPPKFFLVRDGKTLLAFNMGG
jgi:aspartyl aminopeptidase